MKIHDGSQGKLFVFVVIVLLVVVVLVVVVLVVGEGVVVAFFCFNFSCFAFRNLQHQNYPGTIFEIPVNSPWIKLY